MRYSSSRNTLRSRYKYAEGPKDLMGSFALTSTYMKMDQIMIDVVTKGLREMLCQDTNANNKCTENSLGATSMQILIQIQITQLDILVNAL